MAELTPLAGVRSNGTDLCSPVTLRLTAGEDRPEAGQKTGTASPSRDTAQATIPSAHSTGRLNSFRRIDR